MIVDSLRINLEADASSAEEAFKLAEVGAARMAKRAEAASMAAAVAAERAAQVKVAAAAFGEQADAKAASAAVRNAEKAQAAAERYSQAATDAATRLAIRRKAMEEKSARAIEQAAKQASDAVRQSWNRAGEALERVASAATLASAAITAAATVAVNEAAKYDRNVANAVKDLKGAYSALSVQIGRALIPTLKAMAQTVSTVVRWFQSLSPGVKEAAAGFAAFAAGALAVVGTGAKIGSIFAKLAPTILPILPALAAAAAALIAVIVVVGLVQEAWDANFGGIQDITKDTIDYVKKSWATFKAWWKGSAPGIGEAFIKVGNVILTALIYPLEKITQQWSEAARFLGADKIADGLAAVSGTLKEIREGGIAQLGTDLADAGEAFGDGIVRGAKRGFKTTKDLLAQAMGATGKIVSPGLSIEQDDALAGDDLISNKFLAKFKRIQSAMASGPGVTSELTSVYKHLIDAGKLTAGHISRAAENLGASVQQQSVALEDARKMAAQEKKDRVSANATTAQDMVSQNLGGVTDVVNAGMAGGPAGVFAALAMKAESFSTLVEELNGLVSIVADFLNPFIDALRPFINVLGNVLQILAPVFGLLTKLTPVFMVLQLALPIFFEAVRYLGVAILYAAEAVAFVWNGIVDAAAWLVRAIGDLFGAIGLTGVENMLDGFADSITKLRDNTDYAAERTKLMNMSLEEATVSIAKERKERDKLNESILNAPSGFRVPGFRFGAQDSGVRETGGAFQAGGDRAISLTVLLDSKPIAAQVVETQIAAGQRNTGSRWGTYSPEMS